MQETKIVTAPTDLLTVNDVKAALAVTYTDDDMLLTSLITSARLALEKYLGVAIGTQTLKTLVDLNGWEEFEIPYGPVTTLTTAKYKSDFGEYTLAIALDDYDVDGLDFKKFVPFTSGRWELTYEAGYATLPADLKTGWIRLVNWYYENRGDTGTLPEDVKRDVITYKRFNTL